MASPPSAEPEVKVRELALEESNIDNGPWLGEGEVAYVSVGALFDGIGNIACDFFSASTLYVLL
jgi:hypothetical protein